VAFGNQIAMEENLEASLAAIFGAPGTGPLLARVEIPTGQAPAPLPKRETGVRALVDQALQQYSRAQDHLRQGNFGAYGEEIKRLEGTLKTLRDQAR
jgi:hypothetical protein